MLEDNPQGEQALPETQGMRERRPQPQQPNKLKVSFAVRPEHFQGKKGLRALYERTKQLKLNELSEVNVENTMKQIVMVLKSWQFEACPKFTFDYFLQRCQAMATHKQLTAYMSKVRKVHKGLDTWEEAPDQEGTNPNQNQQNQQALEMMSGYAQAQGTAVQMNEEDQEWLQLMQQMEKRQVGKKQRVDEEQSKEPYVPEGYEFDFSEEN